MTRLSLLLLVIAACGSNEESTTSTPAEPIKVEPATLATPTTPAPPPKPVAPFLRITDCARDYDSEDNETDLFVKIGDKMQPCHTYHGPRAKVSFEANPGAQLTINGKTTPIPEDGKLTTIVELVEPLLALAIDDIASTDMQASKALVVPYKLQVGSSTLDGTMAFTEIVGDAGEVARNFLAMVADGKVDRPAFTPAKAGERRTIGLIGLDGRMKLTDRRGTVRELDLVAVMKETGRVESGTCDFESEGRVIRARRFAITVEVTVTNLADGTVVGTKAFSPSATGCPSFAMMDRDNPTTAVSPADKPIMKWLDTLARPTT